MVDERCEAPKVVEHGGIVGRGAVGQPAQDGPAVSRDEDVVRRQGAMGGAEVVEVGRDGGHPGQPFDDRGVGGGWPLGPRVGAHEAGVERQGRPLVEGHELDHSGVAQPGQQIRLVATSRLITGIRDLGSQQSVVPRCDRDATHEALLTP